MKKLLQLLLLLTFAAAITTTANAGCVLECNAPDSCFQCHSGWVQGDYLCGYCSGCYTPCVMGLSHSPADFESYQKQQAQRKAAAERYFKATTEPLTPFGELWKVVTAFASFKPVVPMTQPNLPKGHPVLTAASMQRVNTKKGCDAPVDIQRLAVSMHPKLAQYR